MHRIISLSWISLVCICPLVAQAKKTAPPPKIAVLKPDIKKKVDLLNRKTINESFIEGIQGVNSNLIYGEAVQAALKYSADRCGPACVRQLGNTLKVRYVAGANIQPHRDFSVFYKIHMWIADSISGKIIATVNNKCNICHTAALRNRISLLATQLAVSLKNQEQEPGKVMITSTPSGASIYVDDTFKGKTPKKISVKGGAHLFKLEREGYYSDQQEKKIVSNIEININVALVPKADSPIKPIFGWSLVGLGAASLTAGIIGLTQHNSEEKCTDNLCRSTTDTQPLSTILLIGGGAALVTGATLLLWPDSKPKPEKRAQRWQILPGISGLSLTHQF